MHASRALAPSPRRLAAGLAAAAVVTAGLACIGTASAAEPTNLPQTLDFTPVDLAATGDDVFAVGYVAVDADEDWHFEEVDGYVEAVGSGEKLHLGDGSQPSAVSASPDGRTLYVIGTRVEEDVPDSYPVNVGWTVDTAAMTVSDAIPDEGRTPYAVAAGADGAYTAWTGWSGGAGVSGFADDVTLPDSVQPSHLGVLPGNGGTEEVVVGATDYASDGASSLPTLFTVSRDGVRDRRVLGPDGASNRGFITSMDVDEANRLTYTITVRDTEDGQQYGLNVDSPTVNRFVPLPDPVFGVVVSRDGETVYLMGYSVMAYDADALESYTEGNRAPSSYVGGNINHADVAPSGRIYVAVDNETSEDPEVSETVTTIHALEEPGAPTNLRTTPEGDENVLATWAAPTNRGGVPPDSISYKLTLQDNAGGAPFVTEAWETDLELSGLVPGHTYTLRVATTNGVFSSAPVTTTFTAKPAVAHPAAVSVRGKLAVGSKLTVASRGGWASGTSLSYVWRNDNDRVIGRSATLTLAPAQLGQRLSVQVTGTKAGVAPATVYSDLTAKVARGTLTARIPSVAGKAKVGQKLTARPGRWTAGTRFTYRWTANGKAIKGASASTLKLTRAVAGKQVRVVVTGTKAGYRAATKTSAPTAKVKR